MEEEIKSSENTQESERVFKQGTSLLWIDGPVGRLRFLLLMLGFFVFSFIYLFLFLSCYEIYGSNNRLPVFIAFGVLYLLFYIVFMFVTYSKRAYDILGDKPKAVFYTTMFLISIIAAGFIPYVKYLGSLFAIGLLISLVCIRGKLIK